MQDFLNDYETNFNFERYPKTRKCEYSKYICDDLQIKYLVQMVTDIVQTILRILGIHFKDETEDELKIRNFIENRGIFAVGHWR